MFWATTYPSVEASTDLGVSEPVIRAALRKRRRSLGTAGFVAVAAGVSAASGPPPVEAPAVAAPAGAPGASVPASEHPASTATGSAAAARTRAIRRRPAIMLPHPFHNSQ